MVKWCDDLYFDETIEDSKEMIMNKIEQGICQKGVYVIALASNDNNLFDIYNVNEIQMNYYKKRIIKIVAILGSKEHAISQVASMIMDMINKCGVINPKTYYSFI